MKRIRKMKRVPPSPNEDIKRRIKREERQARKLWLKENSDHNADQLIKDWEDAVASSKDTIVRLAIRAHAFIDSINQANDVLRYGLKMENSDIDTAAAGDLLNKLFRVELAEFYISSGPCDADQKSDMIKRLIAKEFPTRDNVPQSGNINMPMPPRQPRQRK